MRAGESGNLPRGGVTAAEPGDDVGEAACLAQHGWVRQQPFERACDLGRGCVGGDGPSRAGRRHALRIVGLITS